MPPRSRVFSGCAILFLLLALGSGCMQAPLNAPLEQPAASTGYHIRPRVGTPPPDRVAVVLFFSGGGVRASALSFGVMKELAHTPMPNGDRLLDRVQAISAVSGGCFPAAYYCLNGNRLFQDFETTFLKQDVQGALIHRIFSLPYRWGLLSDRYARSDMAAEYYDDVLFHGATFGDLANAPESRPWLLINATDMDTFSTFSFTQDTFDLIGSDLSPYRISRAVAASSAVPGLLTPITLKTYPERRPPPPLLTLAPPPTSLPGESRPDPFQQLVRPQIDPTRRAYIHLVDGGLADNLGISNLVEALGMTRSWSGLLRRDATSAEHIAFVVVNAATEPRGEWTNHPETPGLRAMATALSKSAIRRTNGVLLDLVRASVDDWNRQVRPGDGRPRLHLIGIDFTQLADPAEREFFSHIPTNFRLPPETIDRLTDVGGRLLRESPEFRALMAQVEKAAGKAPR